ncbi:UNVERIFIED_CONTAM: hypothetical protein FKN15_000787 [Acipenser sinensis]
MNHVCVLGFVNKERQTLCRKENTGATCKHLDIYFTCNNVVADILCEFLEVAIHLILYVREVYPSGIFQKRKKYSVPVQMSCHPELNQYIQDTLHCIKPLIVKLLRAFILKISVCDAVLDNNPPGCTFTVLVHTRDAATRNMEKIQVIKDFPWIVADEQDVHMREPRLIPLKTMTSDIVKVREIH